MRYRRERSGEVSLFDFGLGYAAAFVALPTVIAWRHESPVQHWVCGALVTVAWFPLWFGILTIEGRVRRAEKQRAREDRPEQSCGVQLTRWILRWIGYSVASFCIGLVFVGAASFLG